MNVPQWLYIHLSKFNFSPVFALLLYDPACPSVRRSRFCYNALAYDLYDLYRLFCLYASKSVNPI